VQSLELNLNKKKTLLAFEGFVCCGILSFWLDYFQQNAILAAYRF
jgi:hypothetical protein